MTASTIPNTITPGGLNVEEQLLMDYLQKVEGQHEEEAEDYEGETIIFR